MLALLLLLLLSLQPCISPKVFIVQTPLHRLAVTHQAAAWGRNDKVLLDNNVPVLVCLRTRLSAKPSKGLDRMKSRGYIQVEISGIKSRSRDRAGPLNTNLIY